MIKAIRSPAFLLLMVAASAALAVNLALTEQLGNRLFLNEPVHSTLEALGAMSAIVMAIFLLQGKSEQDIEKYSPLSLSFLGMGLLDGFHAVSSAGDGFIFFHSMASLVGGFGSALIWFPKFVSCTKNRNRAHSVIAATLLTFGFIIVRHQELLPAMAGHDAFSPLAVFVNLTAGCLFFVAMAFFLADFLRSRKIESYLFACLYFLFGLAALGFPFSAAWNANWWFWHLQRLAAYLVVLYFLFRTFHRIALEKEGLIIQLNNAFAEVKQLSGLLPICAACKKVRDERGYWKQIETFLCERTEAEFSHGLCPDCTKKAYEELNRLKY